MQAWEGSVEMPMMATQPLCLTRAFFSPYISIKIKRNLPFFPLLLSCSGLHSTRRFFSVFLSSNCLTFWFVRLFSLIETVHFCWRLMQDIKLFFIFHERIVVPIFFSLHFSLFIVRLLYCSSNRRCCEREWVIHKNTTNRIKKKIIAKK